MLFRSKYQDGGSSHLKATKQKLREEYFNNRDKIDQAFKFVGSQKFSCFVGVTPMCAAYIVIGDVNPTLRDEFFYKLVSGENIKSGNPILKAREHLMDMKNKKATAQQRMEAIFRYWNLWRNGASSYRAISIQNEWPKLEA